MKANRFKLWSRRSALQTLALGAGGLAFGAAYQRELGFLSKEARAQLAGPPKRLLVLFNANGINERKNWADWLIPGTTPDGFTLGPVTTPLEKHRSNLVFFENMFFGLNHATAEAGATHDGGACEVLTGANPLDIDKHINAGGMSIDQYLGQKLGAIATPLWPSVQLTGQAEDTYISCVTDGVRVKGIQSPWVAYQQLFQQIPDAGMVAAPDTALLNRVMARQSVLDAVTKDINRLRPQLPPEDQARMDAQLSAIRTLEQRLSAQGSSGGNVVACTKPQLPTMADARDTKNWPAIRRMYSDLIVATLACDISRVVVINWRSGAENRIPSDFDPINSEKYEHLFSHEDLEDGGLFEKIKRWYMEEVAYIADQLAAIPEGNGSMLDNTIVLFATEISTGHQHGRMPWLTVGGKNLGVNVGQSLKLPKIAANDTPDRRESGYPHARLLVSLLNAMGLPDTSYGIPSFGAGPMEGFLST